MVMAGTGAFYLLLDTHREAAGRSLHRGAIVRSMRWPMLCIAIACGGCATVTPAGARVAVYSAPLNSTQPRHGMPAGCTLLSSTSPVAMTELEMTGQNDPFREQRDAAAAVGANAILVLSRMTVDRHTFECPSTSPITDCPPSSGAWYRVVIERYACTPDALRALPAVQEPHRSSGRREDGSSVTAISAPTAQ
jgi:hypothetical protein